MSCPAPQGVIIVFLILLNGLFSRSETAPVSARRADLRQRVESGDGGALDLADSPNRFLSTVQIGIFLNGFSPAQWVGRYPILGLRALAEEREGDYQTVGGMVIAHLGRVRAVGDRFEWEGFSLEVVDVDGHRVDKVLVTQALGVAPTDDAPQG